MREDSGGHPARAGTQKGHVRGVVEGGMGGGWAGWAEEGRARRSFAQIVKNHLGDRSEINS